MKKLLVNVVRQSLIHQHPDDFVHAMDTGIIVSFQNTMNIFHDKRIAFGSTQYLSRSHLAVCHWNENVGHDYTSVWIRSGMKKKGTDEFKRCKKTVNRTTVMKEKQSLIPKVSWQAKNRSHEVQNTGWRKGNLFRKISPTSTTYII
jgi:hypothetical protein